MKIYSMLLSSSTVLCFLVEQSKAHILVGFLLFNLLEMQTLQSQNQIQTFSSSFSSFFSSLAGAAPPPPPAAGVEEIAPPPEGT